MPLIASKTIALGMAASTAIGSCVGGFLASDDISQTSELAVKYAEMKVDRAIHSMIKDNDLKLNSQIYGSKDTGL